jgi:hypothetical protein
VFDTNVGELQDKTVDAQRKLLEYLITKLKNEMLKETSSGELILIWVKSMLKDLEASP